MKHFPATHREPHFDMLGGTVRQALADARQVGDPVLQGEALAWLWICCPDIADELDLPTLEAVQADPNGFEYAQHYSPV